MKVWRICNKKFSATAFSGEGAKLWGGRWNEVGQPMVYTAGNLSLAALETFVHLDSDLMPDELVAIAANIPEKLKVTKIKLTNLPLNWREYPAPDAIKQIGMDWIASQESAVLVVPSVVIPEEENWLINPTHPDFRRIKINNELPFSFDPRMWKIK